MVSQNPGNSFARFGLAMEYRNAGQPDAAIHEFEALLAADPEYAAAYLHAGQTLERAERLDEARAIYRKGIEVTARKGDAHARGELEAALDLLS